MILSRVVCRIVPHGIEEGSQCTHPPTPIEILIDCESEALCTIYEAGGLCYQIGKQNCLTKRVYRRAFVRWKSVSQLAKVFYKCANLM